MNTSAVKPGDFVTHPQFRGIALVVTGYPEVWVPYTYLAEDEDGNEVEIPDEDGEWEVDTESGMVKVVMVGDDRPHLVRADECKSLPRSRFCGTCGQIGCGHNVEEDEDEDE